MEACKFKIEKNKSGDQSFARKIIYYTRLIHQLHRMDANAPTIDILVDEVTSLLRYLWPVALAEDQKQSTEYKKGTS